MPFPTTDRVIYDKNPLTEVICQLTFPTILRISADQPTAFQDRVRIQYPIYQEQAGQNLPQELRQLLARIPIPPPPEGLSHKFLSDDQCRYITLNREFLAVTETKYEQWETFYGAIELAKQALEDAYSPSFYSRVGLRYKDLIDPAALGLADRPWTSLIRPAVAGILADAKLARRARQSATQTVLTLEGIPGGFVRLRSSLVQKPDDEQAYEIDVDCFTTERSAVTDVSSTLHQFNRIAGNLFRWAITPDLHNALGPRPLVS